MFTDGISNKFSFYDQIGYLLVGSIALLMIAGNMWLFNRSESLPSFALQTILVLMVVAYFLGHLVQSVANIIIIEKKDSYTISERKTLDAVRAYFDNSDWSDREAFQHCYILSCGKDIAGHVAAFNAYYSLYRGWLLLFSFEAVYLAVHTIINWFSLELFLLTLASLGIAFLMHYRRRLYWNYVTSKTLQTFIVFRKLSQ